VDLKMAVVQIDTEILRTIVKESVIEAIKTERFKFYESLISEVTEPEMNDIINLYGPNPVDKQYIDITDWFGNEN
jgi:hypothetical protein